MQSLEDLESLRTVIGEDVTEPPGWRDVLVVVRRVVAQKIVLDQGSDGIDAEPVDPSPEPEAHHLLHRLPDLRVAPIEVRLLLQKGVVVVLACRFVEFPGTAAEPAQPVVRRAAIGRGISLYIPIASRTLP